MDYSYQNGHIDKIETPQVSPPLYPDLTFRFTFQPARPLREAIGILCLNSHRDEDEEVTALIEVSLRNNERLEITVRSSVEIEEGSTLGYLSLIDCDMGNFMFTNLFERNFVHLNEIYDILNRSTDDDGSITIFHVDRSSHLSIELIGYANHVGPHNVEILQDNPGQLQRWPENIDIVCSAVISTEWLAIHIPYLKNVVPAALVTMEILDQVVTVKNGSNTIWQCPIQKGGGLEGERYEASFKWTSWDALLSAGNLTRSFKVYFTSDQFILFKFKVHQFGRLWFRKATESMTFNGIEPR